MTLIGPLRTGRVKARETQAMRPARDGECIATKVLCDGRGDLTRRRYNDDLFVTRAFQCRVDTCDQECCCHASHFRRDRRRSFINKQFGRPLCTDLQSSM